MRSRLLVAAGAAALALGGVASVTALSTQAVDMCPDHNSPDNIKIEIKGPQFLTLDETNVDSRVEIGTMICVKWASSNSGIFAWAGSFTAPQQISHYVIYPSNGTTTTTSTTSTTSTTTTLANGTTTTTLPDNPTTTVRDRTTVFPTTTTTTTLEPPDNGPDRDIPIPTTTVPLDPRDIEPELPAGPPRLPATGAAPWLLGLLAAAAIGGGLLARQAGRRSDLIDELPGTAGEPADDGRHR